MKYMKYCRRFTALLMGVIFVFNCAAAVSADDAPVVKINGEPLLSELTAVAAGNTAMIPLRAVFEKLGATVEWDAESECILCTRADAEIELKAAQGFAYINGTKTELSAPPIIHDGRTLVPADFVGKALNCRVDYNATVGVVSIDGQADYLPEVAPAGEMPKKEQIDEYIRRIFAESNATPPKLSEEELLQDSLPYKIISDGEVDFYPTADTYAQGGTSGATIHGAETVIAYKNYTSANLDTARKAFLKFDLSAYPYKTAHSAVLQLRTSYIQDGIVTETGVQEVKDLSWTEDSLCWNNMPTPDSKILGRCSQANTVCMPIKIDLTAFINDCLASGKTEFSICVQDLGNKNGRTEFSSREGAVPPTLTLKLSEEDSTAQAEKKYDYITMETRRTSTPRTGAYQPVQSRVLSSLRDFTPRDTKPELSKYGGDVSRKDVATGFFHVKKIGDRWWMVDPEGYLVMNIAMVNMQYGVTENEKIGQENVYGDNDAWAEGVTQLVKNELGFNAAGAWSNDAILRTVENPISYTKLIYFVTGYGDEIGKTYQDNGHKSFNNNVMPVFDPGFEVFCDRLAAKSIAPLKDDPYLIGWFSDNELPIDFNILDKYLKADASSPIYVYAYETAWEWLRQRHGEGATEADITGRDRMDFLEFVYDRYAYIVSKSIKRYDPNHMYIGSRLLSASKMLDGIHKAMGRYCDVVSLNYYSQWEANVDLLRELESWSGRPVVLTEFYTKGEDSGLGNTSGAGWMVKTQNDRGLHYEQFVLGCLESKTCVGWHWFRYKDNDPNDPNSDPSNVDGNKGIINTAFEVYTDLTDRMRVINYNVYDLIDYFDGDS